MIHKCDDLCQEWGAPDIIETGERRPISQEMENAILAVEKVAKMWPSLTDHLRQLVWRWDRDGVWAWATSDKWFETASQDCAECGLDPDKFPCPSCQQYAESVKEALQEVLALMLMRRDGEVMKCGSVIRGGACR